MEILRNSNKNYFINPRIGSTTNNHTPTAPEISSENLWFYPLFVFSSQILVSLAVLITAITSTLLSPSFK